MRFIGNGKPEQGQQTVRYEVTRTDPMRSCLRDLYYSAVVILALHMCIRATINVKPCYTVPDATMQDHRLADAAAGS